MSTPPQAVSAKLFIEPQTGGLSLAYVTYRVGLAVYFSSVVLRCFLVYGLDYMCLLYLTNWTFLVQTVHIVIQATVVVREYAIKLMHGDTRDVDDRPLPLLLRVDWVLHNITLSMSLVVSFVYWVIIYDGWHLDLNMLSTHAANSACVLIDMSMTNIPVLLIHMYQPIAYGLAYTFGTYLYWLAGGVDPRGSPYIYPILDYSGNPAGTVLVVIITTVATGLIHCAMCWLSQRRSTYFTGKPWQFDDPTTDGAVQELNIRSSGDVPKSLNEASLSQDVLARTRSSVVARNVTSSKCLMASKVNGGKPSLEFGIAALFAPLACRSSLFAPTSTTSLDVANLSPDFMFMSRETFVASLPDIGSLSSNAKMAEVVSLPDIVRAISEYTVSFSHDVICGDIG